MSDRDEVSARAFGRSAGGRCCGTSGLPRTSESTFSIAAADKAALFFPLWALVTKLDERRTAVRRAFANMFAFFLVSLAWLLALGEDENFLAKLLSSLPHLLETLAALTGAMVFRIVKSQEIASLPRRGLKSQARNIWNFLEFRGREKRVTQWAPHYYI